MLSHQERVCLHTAAAVDAMATTFDALTVD